MTDKIHITYRNVEMKDAEDINKYMDKIGKETDFLTYKNYDCTIEQTQEHIEYYNSHNDCLYLLAEDNSQIVGTLAYVGGWKEGMLHLGEMGINVLEAYWGQGIGTELMTQFKKWAIGVGSIQRIELFVHCQNFRAVNLYHKFGFKIEGRHDKKLLVDGIYGNVFSMALLLEG